MLVCLKKKKKKTGVGKKGTKIMKPVKMAPGKKITFSELKFPKPDKILKYLIIEI